MIIGVPKEVKDGEHRVGLTPAGAEVLVRAGHHVLVQKGAGEGSGFADEQYMLAGAALAENADETWTRAEMVMKVKEPLPSEYKYFRAGLLLYTYLHLAADSALTAALVTSGINAIAYETVQLDDGSLPLLTPMSEVAGRMAVQIGARLLEKENGGRGILLGGVAGVPQAVVTIIGGGVVGTNAAKIAVGMGARTTIIDKDARRLRELDEMFGARVTTLMSNPSNIAEAAARADLLVGAVLIPGVKAPKLVDEATVRVMKPGAVIVDVAIDQGGSIETIDRVTTHRDPTYVKHGVVHYSVANMPGAVPYTSTLALTNVTVPYALQIAALGSKGIAAEARNYVLAKGFNTLNGHVVHPGVAQSTGYDYVPLEKAI